MDVDERREKSSIGTDGKSILKEQEKDGWKTNMVG